MARPIMFWAQTDAALLVLTLVIVAKRVASIFSRRLIEPASRKNAPRRFYAHHRGTGSGILDRSAALEAGFDPVVDVTLAGDVVRRHAIVRQVDDHIFPAAPAQFVCVICERLADAFDVIQQPDLAAHELREPDRHRVRPVPRSADVEERLHRQYGINRNTTNPAFLPRLL